MRIEWFIQFCMHDFSVVGLHARFGSRVVTSGWLL